MKKFLAIILLLSTSLASSLSVNFLNDAIVCKKIKNRRDEYMSIGPTSLLVQLGHDFDKSALYWNPEYYNFLNSDIGNLKLHELTFRVRAPEGNNVKISRMHFLDQLIPHIRPGWIAIEISGSKTEVSFNLYFKKEDASSCHSKLRSMTIPTNVSLGCKFSLSKVIPSKLIFSYVDSPLVGNLVARCNIEGVDRFLTIVPSTTIDHFLNLFASTLQLPKEGLSISSQDNDQKPVGRIHHYKSDSFIVAIRLCQYAFAYQKLIGQVHDFNESFYTNLVCKIEIIPLEDGSFKVVIHLAEGTSDIQATFITEHLLRTMPFHEFRDKIFDPNPAFQDSILRIGPNSFPISSASVGVDSIYSWDAKGNGLPKKPHTQVVTYELQINMNRVKRKQQFGFKTVFEYDFIRYQFLFKESHDWILLAPTWLLKYICKICIRPAPASTDSIEYWWIVNNQNKDLGADLLKEIIGTMQLFLNACGFLENRLEIYRIRAGDMNYNSREPYKIVPSIPLIDQGFDYFVEPNACIEDIPSCVADYVTSVAINQTEIPVENETSIAEISNVMTIFGYLPEGSSITRADMMNCVISVLNDNPVSLHVGRFSFKIELSNSVSFDSISNLQYTHSYIFIDKYMHSSDRIVSIYGVNSIEIFF